MEQVLTTLSFEDLSNLCATNLEYREFCENDRIWETLYLRDYGTINKPVVSWKFEYLLQKAQPKMALVDRDIGLIKVDLPFLPSAYIQKVVFMRPYLLVLERSGSLYFGNREDQKPVTFQLMGSQKFSDISNRTNLAVSTEGKLLFYHFYENSLTVEPLLDLANEVISELIDGFGGNIYAISSQRDLFKISQTVQKIGSGADMVYPLSDNKIIIISVRNAYFYDGYEARPLVINQTEIPARMIREVRENKILLQDGKLYGFTGFEFVNWSEQWAYFDPKWHGSIIQSISDNFLVLIDGSVYDIFYKVAMSAHEFNLKIQELSYSDPKRVQETAESFLPILIDFPEKIVLMSGKGFFGEDGTFFIRTYLSYSHGKFEYGFKPKHLYEINPGVEYAFWRNFELTISQDLYRLLLEKGVVDGDPKATSFWYQQQLIRVASD